jgi:hypothetical protein
LGAPPSGAALRTRARPLLSANLTSDSPSLSRRDANDQGIRLLSLSSTAALTRSQNTLCWLSGALDEVASTAILS